MTTHSLEKQLSLVINLLETLPKRLCDELERRHEISEKLKIQSEVEFYSSNADEIREFIDGFKQNMGDNGCRSEPVEEHKKNENKKPQKGVK